MWNETIYNIIIHVIKTDQSMKNTHTPTQILHSTHRNVHWFNDQQIIEFFFQAHAGR